MLTKSAGVCVDSYVQGTGLGESGTEVGLNPIHGRLAHNAMCELGRYGKLSVPVQLQRQLEYLTPV
jgi:hypothetical protein